MRRACAAAGTTTLLFALIVSCSNNDSNNDEESSRDAVVTTSALTSFPSKTTTSPVDSTSAPTTQTQTPDTEPIVLEQVLQSLLGQYDAAVADILADPRVASDRESEPVRTYLALFAPDSAFADGALRSWEAEGANGRFYRAGPRGKVTESTLATIDSSTESEATFSICAVNSFEIVDAAGTVLEAQGGVTAATVVAVRIDGSWVLRDLTQSSAATCPRPGADG